MVVGMLLALLHACGGGEDAPPALTAVKAPPPAAVEAARERRVERERKAVRETATVAYTKPRGVYIDAPYFAGRSWEAARDEVDRQFGAVRQEETTPDKARKVTLERGSIRVVDGRIQTLEIPLAEPVRRSEALAVLGIPASADAWRSFAYEFRTNNLRGFRRVRLLRATREGELVNRAELWSFLNRERR